MHLDIVRDKKIAEQHSFSCRSLFGFFTPPAASWLSFSDEAIRRCSKQNRNQNGRQIESTSAAIEYHIVNNISSCCSCLLYIITPISSESYLDRYTSTMIHRQLSNLVLLSLLASALASSTPVEFGANLQKFSCDTSATATPGVPVPLPAISTANGPKTILLSPLVSSNSSAAEDDGRMCILSRWSQGETEQLQGQGHYHPLGRSVPTVSNGEWTRPPGKPGRELKYTCGIASNSGSEFNAGEYLCQVTLPITEKVFVDFSTEKIFAPYYITYYERQLSVKQEISRFLQKASFGPTLDDLDSLSSAHDKLVQEEGLSKSQAMSLLQTKWIKSQMDPSSFSTGSFSSLRKYWRQRLNARAFEVYRIGEAGPAPCEAKSRWRKFAFTKYDVQNARYLRWGEGGVTTQNQNVSTSI